MTAANVSGLPTAVQVLGDQADKLRCLECGGRLELTFLSERPGYPELGPDGTLSCIGCAEHYPVVAGTPRMLTSEHRRRLPAAYPLAVETLSRHIDSSDQPPNAEVAIKQLTADSFAYEWEQFGSLRDEWAKNFADYMQPHSPGSLAGQVARHRDRLGPTQLSRGICRGARRGGGSRRVDRCRATQPPAVSPDRPGQRRGAPVRVRELRPRMSIGVLHPPARSRSCAPFDRPIRAPWWQRARVPVLGTRAALAPPGAYRRDGCAAGDGATATSGLALALLSACGCAAGGVRRAVSRAATPAARARRSGSLPLKTDADYPFSVLVNDQFDRFSATAGAPLRG